MTAFSLFCLFALCACAVPPAGSAEPDWLRTRQLPAYPESAYLIGIGTASGGERGSVLRQAKDRAVADIAAQLESHVRQEVTTIVRETLDVRNGDARAQSLTRMSEDLQVFTEATFVGTQQVAEHFDAQQGFGAVMVAIDRRAQALRERQQVTQLDAEIEQLSREAADRFASGRGFQAAIRLRRAEERLVTRAAAASRANLILPGAVPGHGATTLGEVVAKEREAAASVGIVLACRHRAENAADESAALEQRFVAAFGEQGIRVEAARGDASRLLDRWQDPATLETLLAGSEGQVLLLNVEATTGTRPVGEADLIRVESSGVARLIDAKTGELLVSVSYSPDASGHTPQIGPATVRSRLMREALAQLANILFERVMETLR